MSAPLNVDPAQLHAVSGLAADVARDLQRELDQLEHRWEDLSSTWDGVASRAFGPEFDAWRGGALKTVAALDSASVTLAQHGYAFAESEAMSAQNIAGE
ncbi:WXG100 family type VII secretion target [Mycobacteroides abscessus]|uniref:WXG100 family type VII secretion target n=1 Tax=Mycobacteroides abscessus TaxID=36809 RepID=UPI000C25AA67|nr:WXG100 family type VII secretion target [Mycobacteroides abscessus]RIR08316.1 WXG100 family type VII secretion target [Mycobacteroides abscessus]